MHKFDILLSKWVVQALRIDQKMGTTFWKDAIQKEMQSILPAFGINDRGKVPVAHTKIDCHMIFDIKIPRTWSTLAWSHGTVCD
jgi:hypothetical protein